MQHRTSSANNKPTTLQIIVKKPDDAPRAVDVQEFKSRIAARMFVYKTYGISVSSPQMRKQVVLDTDELTINRLEGAVPHE